MRGSRSLSVNGKLATTAEAAERKRKLGLEVGNEYRGFGFKPAPDRSNLQYADEERTRDATALFITRCVLAYRDGTLSSTEPIAPHQIRSRIRSVGGNIKWFQADVDRRQAFHNEYCRLVGRIVRYGDVWLEGNRPKSAGNTRKAPTKKTATQEQLEKARRQALARAKTSRNPENKSTGENIKARLQGRMQSVVVVKRAEIEKQKAEESEGRKTAIAKLRNKVVAPP